LKGREFAKLARRHLMHHLPGFAVKDGLIYAVPLGRLLRGFRLGPSVFSRERFTISCLVAPLYQPEAADAGLSGLGDRLPHLAGRGREWWEWRPDDADAEAQLMADIRALMLETGVPFLARLATVEDVARTLSGQPDHRSDPYVAEALAYRVGIAVSAERILFQASIYADTCLTAQEIAAHLARAVRGSVTAARGDTSSRRASS
jgi:hypothetical protein